MMRMVPAAPRQLPHLAVTRHSRSSCSCPKGAAAAGVVAAGLFLQYRGSLLSMQRVLAAPVWPTVWPEQLRHVP